MEDREYNEIEIEAAKNALGEGFEWAVRDENGLLYVYREKPEKRKHVWLGGGFGTSFTRFAPLLPQIKWEDEEPVRLRDIVPQILTDDEREWLRVVVRPFRDRLKTVEAYDGMFYGRYIRFCVEPPEEYEEQPSEDDFIQISRESFTRMEARKEYTPEELGI